MLPSEYSLLYVFQDPFGLNDSKAGKTRHPAVRLGVYQNSYSRRSHIAKFDFVYYGDKTAIDSLERAVKREFNWDIERDGRGFSEWISNHLPFEIVEKIDEVIKGYRYKVYKVPKRFLPLTVDNLSEFQQWLVDNK